MRDKKAQAAYESMLEGQERATLKFPPFNLAIDGQIFIEQNENTVTLHHHLCYLDGVATCNFPGVMEFPAGLFKDEKTLRKFAALVDRVARNMFIDFLAEETVLLFNDVAHFALNEFELESVDLRKQANLHGRDTARRLKKLLGVERKGKQAQWKRTELARAVLAAVNKLPKEERTLVKIADEMREHHPGRIPETTEAFRKLLTRHDLSWRKLKNGRIF